MSVETGTLPIDIRFSDAELDKHHDHIISFIQTQLDDAGVDQAVIGLSGGIDSTLTAHLSVQAIRRWSVPPDGAESAKRTPQTLRTGEIPTIPVDVSPDTFSWVRPAEKYQKLRRPV